MSKAPWLRDRYDAMRQKMVAAGEEQPMVQAIAGHELLLRGSGENVARAVVLLQKAWRPGENNSQVGLDLAQVRSGGAGRQLRFYGRR